MLRRAPLDNKTYLVTAELPLHRTECNSIDCHAPGPEYAFTLGKCGCRAVYATRIGIQATNLNSADPPDRSKRCVI